MWINIKDKEPKVNSIVDVFFHGRRRTDWNVTLDEDEQGEFISIRRQSKTWLGTTHLCKDNDDFYWMYKPQNP